MSQLGGMRRAIAVFLDDLECKTMTIFHADGSQDGSDGAGGPALPADNLAYIRGSNAQAQGRAFGPLCQLQHNFGGSIDERFGDIDNERPNLFTFFVPLHKTPPIVARQLESEGNTGRRGTAGASGTRRNSSLREAAGSSFLLSSTIGRLPI